MVLRSQSLLTDSSLEPVSVIIPTYNRAEFLAGSISSVLNQEYQEFELVVVDDGSIDTTTQLLAEFGDRLRIVTQQNLGASAARNAGIRAARYDLLAFLDSDDRFAPGKLVTQAAAMAEHPDALISHTDEVWFRNNQLLNQKKIHTRSGGDLFAKSLRICVVGMSTVMVRRGLFDEVGIFDETLPCCEDYDLWLRVACRFPFLLVAAPLTIKHGGRPDQLSRIHRVGMDRFRIRALKKILDSDDLDPDQERLARIEFIRKCEIYGRGCMKHGRNVEGEHYLQLALGTESRSSAASRLAGFE